MRELPMDPISYEKVTVVSVLQQGLGRLEYVGCGGFGMGLDIGQDQTVNTRVGLLVICNTLMSCSSIV